MAQPNRWQSRRALRSLMWASAAGAGALAWAEPGSAQPLEPPPGDVAAQHYQPTPAGDRFFTVPDAHVRGILDGYAKVEGTYAHRPLRQRADGREYLSQQLYGYVDLTLSLAELALLNVDLPIAIWQAGAEGFSSEPGSALGDLRATLRVGAWQLPRREMALGVQADVWFPTGDVDAFAGDGAVRANPQLLLGGTLDWFTYALTAGYLFRERWRDPLAAGEVGGAITYGAALGALLWHDTLQVGPELRGQAVIPDPDYDGALFDDGLTPAEMLFGAKLRLGFVVIGAAAGPGLTAAPGVASYRFVGSLGFIEDQRTFDRDGDRTEDDLDRCPDEPGFDERGCPRADRDGDTVLDVDDACPDLPGLVHADATKHGCPPR